MDGNLKKLQQTELQILVHFTELCAEHHLTYYLMDGTLLGAVRHAGFVPWDDDVDVAMPREDYERLIELLSRDGAYPYQLKNYQKDPTYTKRVTRIVDERVQVHHSSYVNNAVENAWIDIFPLDAVPNNILIRSLWKIRFLAVMMFYYYSCFDSNVNLDRKDRPLFVRMLIRFGQITKIGRKLNTRKLLDRMEAILKKVNHDKAQFWVIPYSSYLFKEQYRKEWFGEGKELPFEGHIFRVPDGYREILEHLYGDYMQLPPVEKRAKHTITRIEIIG